MCVCKPLKDHAVAAVRNSQHISTVKFSLSFDAAMAVMSGQYCGLTAGSKPPFGPGLSVCLCGVFLFFPCLGVFSLDIRASLYSPKTKVSGPRSECESE